MVPYYEADTLFRIMDNRFERVKLARIFYLEYLKLMNHYGLLDKDVKAQFKFLMQKIEKEEMPEAEEEQTKKKVIPQVYYQEQFLDRESKLAMFKRKRDLEMQLDILKDYKDEEMKRDFYMR